MHSQKNQLIDVNFIKQIQMNFLRKKCLNAHFQLFFAVGSLKTVLLNYSHFFMQFRLFHVNTRTNSQCNAFPVFSVDFSH